MNRCVVKKLLVLGAILALTAGACGGGDDDTTPADGGADAPPVLTGDYHKSVLSALAMPNDQMTKDLYSFDLDNIGNSHDNALGSVLILLGAQGGLNVQPNIDDAIAGGSLILLNSIQADTLTSDTSVSWQVYLGKDPMPDPPAFDGSDMFTVDTQGPDSAKLLGTIDASGVFNGGPGQVPLSIPLEMGATPIEVTLWGTQIHAKVDAMGCGDVSAADPAKLGGAIKDEDVHGIVIPAIADISTTVIARDCVGCVPGMDMCTPMSSGATVESLFDADMDCVVTAAELEANQLVQAALNPDVDLFDQTGAYNPGADPDNPDSLSIGVGIKCVTANFTTN